ncbi:unnamed protein product [Pedinophyceae sp. YPF-701]|nr:unnamed protein product [Pedinophyceae sp. YPF-701]
MDKFVVRQPVQPVEPEEAFRRYWGKERVLRPLQKEAIRHVLNGEDTFVRLATGGGKSLCYQVPALARNGVVVVITPLLALGTEQVAGLVERGIHAALWSSETRITQRRDIARDLQDPRPKLRLLYTCPESLEAQTGLCLRDILAECHACGNLVALAVDEAHCIVEWGQSFRKSFTRLGALRDSLPGVPFMALTASATKTTVDKICAELRMHAPRMCMADTVNRPEIRYDVRFKDDANPDADEQHLVDTLGGMYEASDSEGGGARGPKGIVYAWTKATCERLAKKLRENGIPAAHFHSDVPDKARVQNDWATGKVPCVVCTIALGMGLDVPDIRYVIHWDAPDSMTKYYQESGRGGRDGQPCRALLYASSDTIRARARVLSNDGDGDSVATKALEKVFDWIRCCGCKRTKLLKHFGESRTETCKGGAEEVCCWCRDPKAARAALPPWARDADGGDEGCSPPRASAAPAAPERPLKRVCLPKGPPAEPRRTALTSNVQRQSYATLSKPFKPPRRIGETGAAKPHAGAVRQAGGT